MARRSFGTVRRLASGRFQARYTDLDGRQKVAPKTFETKREANDWLAALQTDRNRGQLVDPGAGNQRFAAWADAWVDTRMVRGRRLAPRTAELYRAQLRLHINPVLGAYRLNELTPTHVRQWHAQLCGPEGPGASTAAKCYRLLRAILSTAVDEDRLVRNPASIRGAGQEPQKTRPALTADHVGRLAEAVDERWRALILLAAWAGLRFSELAALKRSAIDLHAGVVTVHEAAVDVTGEPRRYERPKSDAGQRSVAIPPHVLGDLEHHLAHYVACGPGELVFTGPKGGLMRRATFNRGVWQPAKAAARLPERATFHDLRAFSATAAARQGATVKELMHRLGHSSVAAAMKYQRAEAERDRSLASAMSAAVRDQRTTQG